MNAAVEYLQLNYTRFREQFGAFIRMKSVSADAHYAEDTKRAAAWTADYLKKIGIEHVQMLTTTRYPIVYGDWLHAPGKPTVLIYGHYDVQPAEPLDKWVSGPYEIAEREGKMYARGILDNKGQLAAMLYAIEAIMATDKKLPLNVKFFIEGDEESGDAGIRAVEKYPNEVACDAVLISDSCWLNEDHPAIFYGMKGLAALEITLRGAKGDVHSGVFGNLIPNPNNALAQLLAPLVPFNGKIGLPGFYDDVIDPTPEERAAYAKFPVDEAEFKTTYGVEKPGVGESAFSLRERNWVRPTCDINGIGGGYQGEGFKTVIPSEASAKISFRLVPNQSHDKIIQLFTEYVRKNLPQNITLVKLEVHNSADPVFTSPSDPFVQAGVTALSRATGKEALLAREAASIPIAIKFREIAKAPVLLYGMGFHDGNIHGPNEHLSVEQWKLGMISNVHMLFSMSDVKK